MHPKIDHPSVHVAPPPAEPAPPPKKDVAEAPAAFEKAPAPRARKAPPGPAPEIHITRGTRALVQTGDISNFYVKTTRNSDGTVSYEIGSHLGVISDNVSSLFAAIAQPFGYVRRTTYVHGPDAVDFLVSKGGLAAQSAEVRELLSGLKELHVPTRKKILRAARTLAQIGYGSKGKILDERYWMEAADKTHRSVDGEEFATRRRAWREDGNTTLSFPEWEKLHFGVGQGEGERVAYLTPAQRRPYEIQIERDGSGGVILRRQDGQPLDTTNEETGLLGRGSAIFVIGQDGRLYASSPPEGTFHHSSFLGGGAVMGAGEIATDASGHIVRFSSNSGHYKPDDETVCRALQHLEDSGVDLWNVEFVDARFRREFDGLNAGQVLMQLQRGRKAAEGEKKGGR